jgi:hypothetical protein
MLNALPTYENIAGVYNELELPRPIESQGLHQKEKLIFMIINLVRVRPKIFMQ